MTDCKKEIGLLLESNSLIQNILTVTGVSEDRRKEYERAFYLAIGCIKKFEEQTDNGYVGSE